VSAAFYSGLRFLSMLFIKLLIGSENASRPVSRVLSLKMVIYLVRLSPAVSSQPTRWLSGPPQRHLFGLASDGVYIASGVTVGPVVSYTAISPLPLRAVSFLLHLSWDRSRQTLSGILPCEARTFLTCACKHTHSATIQPARIYMIQLNAGKFNKKVRHPVLSCF